MLWLATAGVPVLKVVFWLGTNSVAGITRVLAGNREQCCSGTGGERPK